MVRATMRADVGWQESVRVHLVKASQWQGPSGHVYELPAGFAVELGEMELSGAADDLVALLDGALTQMQSMMDAEEEENR